MNQVVPIMYNNNLRKRESIMLMHANKSFHSEPEFSSLF